MSEIVTHRRDNVLVGENEAEPVEAAEALESNAGGDTGSGS